MAINSYNAFLKETNISRPTTPLYHKPQLFIQYVMLIHLQLVNETCPNSLILYSRALQLYVEYLILMP